MIFSKQLLQGQVVALLTATPADYSYRIYFHKGLLMVVAIRLSDGNFIIRSKESMNALLTANTISLVGITANDLNQLDTTATIQSVFGSANFTTTFQAISLLPGLPTGGYVEQESTVAIDDPLILKLVSNCKVYQDLLKKNGIPFPAFK